MTCWAPLAGANEVVDEITFAPKDGLGDARTQPNHGEAARVGFLQNKTTDGGWGNSSEDFESEGGEKGWRGDN